MFDCMILNYIHWNPDPEIIDFGFIAPRWYGLLWALAFLTGYAVLQRIFKKEHIQPELLDSLTLYMIVATILGARLGHCLFYDWEYYSKHPIEIFAIWQGGLASHGAAVGILTGLYLFCKKHKKDYFWVLDRVVIVVALGGGFIRLGNLLNSEIIGKPTEVPWAFIFERVDQVPRHPAQLYEAFFCFILFAFLLGYYRRNVTQLKDGVIFSVFLIALFLFRFLIEFAKDVQVDFERGMTLNMGQLLSIPFVLAGIFLLVNRLKKAPKNYLALARK